MNRTEALVLSFYTLLPGWICLGAGVVCLVLAALPPKRNRRVRR